MVTQIVVLPSIGGTGHENLGLQRKRWWTIGIPKKVRSLVLREIGFITKREKLIDNEITFFDRKMRNTIQLK